jgi:hypothetical protein
VASLFAGEEICYSNRSMKSQIFTGAKNYHTRTTKMGCQIIGL